MEFLFEYGLFFAKTVTFVVALVIILSLLVGASQKAKQSHGKGHLEVTSLNPQFEDLKETMLLATTDELLQKDQEKELAKAKKKEKAEAKKALKKFLQRRRGIYSNTS